MKLILISLIYQYKLHSSLCPLQNWQLTCCCCGELWRVCVGSVVCVVAVDFLLILVAAICGVCLAVDAVAIGHRLRWLVDAIADAIVVVAAAAGAKWRWLRVHRTDREVLPVGAGHLLGRMNGERHLAVNTCE